MTILVFGKSGQVARELARARDVHALGRDDADLNDPAVCAAKIHDLRPSLVINAAAYTAVDKAEEQEALALVVNGEAPGAMARACVDQGIPFLHVSTDYVFDGTGKNRWSPQDETNPISAYGRTKLAGESAVSAVGGDFAILRTSWVFSAHGSNFVKTMLRLGATRDALSVVGDQIGGPTPAADIATTLLAMGDRFLAGSGARGIYHFSGAPDTSWAGFAREIFARARLNVRVSDIPTKDYPTPAARPLNSRMDCSDLVRDYGIAPPDWRRGLDQVLAELGPTFGS